ncbi:hypothetical protein S7711_11139 [Stachybotrys chartarum IBT 7711]|uniref:Uncharacterized protein n=1 Tax=Stachybotrys chartarum (strain CBS 109288 / IBT 7711) TaxID=1280523 RepID=A0A084AZF8_STACB|nr:hypothetical protein S7711_11139 [Stachybotrys chartarum IBT 7711]KFA50367.1 hypothetical protein S40293_11192 [Stachybotrys chartarum IBT 40293]
MDLGLPSHWPILHLGGPAPAADTEMHVLYRAGCLPENTIQIHARKLRPRQCEWVLEGEADGSWDESGGVVKVGSWMIQPGLGQVGRVGASTYSYGAGELAWAKLGRGAVLQPRQASRALRCKNPTSPLDALEMASVFA